MLYWSDISLHFLLLPSQSFVSPLFFLRPFILPLLLLLLPRLPVFLTPLLPLTSLPGTALWTKNCKSEQWFSKLILATTQKITCLFHYFFQLIEKMKYCGNTRIVFSLEKKALLKLYRRGRGRERERREDKREGDRDKEGVRER